MSIGDLTATRAVSKICGSPNITPVLVSVRLNPVLEHLEPWAVDIPLLHSYYSPIMASERVQRQIDRFLDNAEAAMAQFDWETVRHCAQAVLAISPDNSDAATFLAAAERALAADTAPPPIPQPTPSTPVSTPIAPVDQPTSFTNGRYQVRELLGEGAKRRSTWLTTPPWTEKLLLP